jgi:hypothetical protein
MGVKCTCGADKGDCVDCMNNRINELEAITNRLKGQLINCINHLDNANRHGYRRQYDKCIEDANKALYEITNT